MSELIPGLLDSARLLFDLQRANQIAQSFAGYLEPQDIARRVTDGLVEKFDCAFARVWLVEPDRTHLKLVASSGLYTRLNGAFARVPMGAYKVGKIAQNRVSFLSNQLAEEPWVRDRNWAIANQIQGFAGYPLTIGDQVVGVLAAFSHQAMAPEFLEVLQFLCTTIAVTLETALRYQQNGQPSASAIAFHQLSLSDQLATLLSSVRLALIGREQPLTLPCTYVFLQAADVLNHMECQYCRLNYGKESVALEAIVAAPSSDQQDWMRSSFGSLFFAVSCLGGTLQLQASDHQKVIQVLLQLPYFTSSIAPCVRIECRLPLLQLAFTHLAYTAKLRICETDPTVPLLTDDPHQMDETKRVLWVKYPSQAVPRGVWACLDLSISAGQLRQAVEAVHLGKTWGLEAEAAPLSEREQEIMTLLAQGLRDRDIANQLFISESTVKFHLNNVLTKLKARTRYQALYHGIVNGWIGQG